MNKNSVSKITLNPCSYSLHLTFLSLHEWLSEIFLPIQWNAGLTPDQIIPAATGISHSAHSSLSLVWIPKIPRSGPESLDFSCECLSRKPHYQLCQQPLDLASACFQAHKYTFEVCHEWGPDILPQSFSHRLFQFINLLDARPEWAGRCDSHTDSAVPDRTHQNFEAEYAWSLNFDRQNPGALKGKALQAGLEFMVAVRAASLPPNLKRGKYAHCPLH